MSGPSSSAVKAALPYGRLGDCKGKVAVAFKWICHLLHISVMSQYLPVCTLYVPKVINFGMYPEWVEILAGPWKMEGYLWLQAKGFLNAMIVFRTSIFA